MPRTPRPSGWPVRRRPHRWTSRTKDRIPRRTAPDRGVRRSPPPLPPGSSGKGRPAVTGGSLAARYGVSTRTVERRIAKARAGNWPEARLRRLPPAVAGAPDRGGLTRDLPVLHDAQDVVDLPEPPDGPCFGHQ
ncbi:HTH domain-containing protein [Streptomyces sp. A1136]|uniref:HTH domain-containing protein n=1 Tax=Streptomyces sp. A1136 TaxID=2563102 RepID=UPI0034D34A33